MPPCQMIVDTTDLFDGAQVADAWGASSLGAGVTDASGMEGPTATANTNKVLLDAQKQLRISQQRVRHATSYSCACVVCSPA